MTRASSSQPWKPGYVVVQGNRVLWWKTEKDLDRGVPPEGQIVLRGHAGERDVGEGGEVRSKGLPMEAPVPSSVSRSSV